jgi:hypothetical protein
MALTFHTPSPSSISCINTYTSFTPIIFPFVLSVSNLANALFVLRRPWIGPLKSMKTIMMLKICKLLPDMYIMIAFMGSCFEGASAISQAFFSLSASVSAALRSEVDVA